MRAVVDPNVIISAILSPRGSPANVLRLWLEGAYEFVCSPLLLAELERALSYPKLRQYVPKAEADELLRLLRRATEMQDDPDEAPDVSSPDPGDDYLVALAAAARAVIVSGDGHLLGLADRVPVYSPAEFLLLLDPDV